MTAVEYLKSVPQMLEGLSGDASPSFGVMTPQHMLEHLIWVTKSSIKDFGPAPDRSELPEKVLKFMHFIESGKPMKYIAKDVTADDLNDLRLESLEAAKQGLADAIGRLINDYDNRGDKPYYNPMMGVVSKEHMIDFHKRHYVHHLESQYGLASVNA